MDTPTLIDMNRQFQKKLNELISLKGHNIQFFTNTRYTQMIQKVKSSKEKVSNKKPDDYQRLRRFDVMTIGETEKLIVPLKEDNVIKLYVREDEIFQILHETHLAIEHGGRSRMEKQLSSRYKNITRQMIVLYLNLCLSCKKRYTSKKSLSVTPILSSEINANNARCQVDLIEMEAQGDDEYKFILVHQDYRTKFIQLRPLKSKKVKEVACTLLDIFTIFGAPSVLHSDSGRVFTNKIIQELYDMWPELKIIHGKLGQTQIQESVECVNQDIKNRLSSWLKINKQKKWSDGLRFVQLMKNRAYHIDLNCSPYEAMFENNLKDGQNNSIAQDTVKNINSEKGHELLNIKNEIETFDDTKLNSRLQMVIQPFGPSQIHFKETNDNFFENQDRTIKSEKFETILVSNPISISEIDFSKSNGEE